VQGNDESSSGTDESTDTTDALNGATPESQDGNEIDSEEALIASPAFQKAWAQVGAKITGETAPAVTAGKLPSGDKGSPAPATAATPNRGDLQPAAGTKSGLVPAATTTAPKEEAAPADSTLSPVLRQAAKRNGWDDADIDNLYAANPEVAERTFERLQESANALSEQYAKIGQARSQAAPAPSAATADATSNLDKLFSEDGLKRFAEANGQDIVDTLLKPLAAERAEYREAVAYVYQQKAEALNRTVTGALDGFAKELPDIYGKGAWGELTPEQQAFRTEVVQQGDWMIRGAREQGINLTHTEALERAHLQMTAKHRAQIERDNLKRAVTQRSNRTTIRPSQRQPAKGAAGGEAGSMESALAAATAVFQEKGW
jgi:hypothetical protein